MVVFEHTPQACAVGVVLDLEPFVPSQPGVVNDKFGLVARVSPDVGEQLPLLLPERAHKASLPAIALARSSSACSPSNDGM